MALSNCVKELRIKMDINQTEFARLCGVSRQTIHSIEVSKYVPSVELSLIIAKVLDKKVEEVFRLIPKED